MRTILSILYSVLIILWTTSANAQQIEVWRLEKIDYYTQNLTIPLQISPSGNLIASSGVGLTVHNLETNTLLLDANRNTGLMPHWLNDTLIYQEYLSTYTDQPSCLGATELTFSFYDARSNTTETRCTVPPDEYINSVGLDYIKLGTKLDRVPFAEKEVLAQDYFILNIANGQWRNISSQLPSSVNRSNLVNTVGFGSLWWNPNTQLPVARLETQGTANPNSFTEVQDQGIQICPLAQTNGTCDVIVSSIQPYVHGYIVDAIVAGNGRTILWAARVFPSDQVVTQPPASDVSNVVAFATDLASGTTTQIFQLYSQVQASAIVDTLPARNQYDARWSAGGHALVISYRGSIDTEFRIAVAHFSRSTQ